MPLPIKVGFVGLSATGWAASALGPALLQPSVKDYVDLVAVSTTSKVSAEASAEKYGKDAGHGVKAYHGASSVVAGDPDVDFVAVSVKTPLHNQVVLPVIAAQKPFFVEWPAGSSYEETREIAEAARKAGVKSLVGLQGRSSPAVQKVKELLASGVIGAVRSSTFIGLSPRELGIWQPQANGVSRYVLDPKNGVTPLIIAAGHQLDSFMYLLGDFATLNASSAVLYPVATIYEDGKPTDETVESTASDHFTISGVLRSGAFATIVWRVGYPTTKGRRSLLWEIDGEDGSIRLESETTSYMNIANPAVYLNGEKVDVEDAEAGVLGIIGAAWIAYAKGEKEKYADIDDALKTRGVLNAVERSLEEGKTIVLD